MKLTKIVHGQGKTVNTGNYESIRVYNELEVSLDMGEDKKMKAIQAKLRKAVEELNGADIQALLG